MSLSFRYVGGKSNLAKKIIKYFPKHQTYIEPFGGSAKVLLAKTPSKLEVYNDLDKGVAAIFICLNDDKLKDQLLEKIYSNSVKPIRELFYYYRDYKLDYDDVINRAFRKIYLLYFSYMSKQSTFVGGRLKGNKPERISKSAFNNIISELTERNLIIESIDFERLLKTYVRDKTVIYCDPPYFTKENHYNNFNFDWEDHLRLKKIINELTKEYDCSFFISYNNHKKIKELYSDFYTISFSNTYHLNINTTQKNPKHKEVTELLFSNKPFQEHTITANQKISRFFKTKQIKEE